MIYDLWKELSNLEHNCCSVDTLFEHVNIGVVCFYEFSLFLVSLIFPFLPQQSSIRARFFIDSGLNMSRMILLSGSNYHIWRGKMENDE